ncbi:DoxX family protein [Streptomyces sp. Ru87]|uniref:DoxX family protein n=1 Tax=Streptomyces sp. Ru87 TaxID=2044307 RepID=UPI000BF6796C|nr:DoxX family protein [Streptomyces sp. Ru87]PGH46730.1 hypothetical protein CRI70_32430 [Streptomyces sp. Ru87]
MPRQSATTLTTGTTTTATGTGTGTGTDVTADPTTGAPARGRGKRAKAVTVLVLRVALGLFFIVASAVPKLIAHSSATEGFDKIGFGDWFMYLTGVLELAGGIALLIPLLSGLAAFSLIGLMACAFVTVLTVYNGENAATPPIIAALLAVVALHQRGTVVELFALLRSRLPGTARA